MRHWKAMLVLAAAALVWAQNESTLQRAIRMETLEGNLKGAIESYRKLSQGKDRAIAAKALVRMGQCYEKLGDAEARKAFERVVREFGDQGEAVAQAKAALARNGQGSGKVARLLAEGRGLAGEGVSLSADGRLAVFQDEDRPNIVLHDISTGSRRLLTDEGNYEPLEQAEAGETPVISRDGKQAAYSWFSARTDVWEVRIVSLQTPGLPAARKLFSSSNGKAEYLRVHDWSPDGRWLAVGGVTNKMKTSLLGLLSTSDGSLRVLKTNTENMGGPVPSWFSPDGKFLLCITYQGGRGRISASVISVDGKSEVPLVSGSSSYSPVWSPEGSHVVFVSDRGGAPGLWSTRVADGKPVGEPELLKAEFRDASPVAISRDGSLFYSVAFNQSNVYVAGLDATSGRLSSEPKRVNQRSIGKARGPIAWLPDGKSLSFWNGREQGDVLVVHTLASGEERDIRAELARNCIGWFPDGRSMMTFRVQGQQRVFRRVDASTGDVLATWTVENVTPHRSVIAPHVYSDYSPDLMTMYFWRRDESSCQQNVCTFIVTGRDLQTGRDREVLRVQASTFSGLKVSPDGRELAIVLQQENYQGKAQILVARIDGGATRELYTVAGFARPWLAWTPSGSHLLGVPPMGREVRSFPAKGGPPEKSQVSRSISASVLYPAVSPDGRQIAFAANSWKGELWTMSGLFSEAK